MTSVFTTTNYINTEDLQERLYDVFLFHNSSCILKSTLVVTISKQSRVTNKYIYILLDQSFAYMSYSLHLSVQAYKAQQLIKYLKD